MGKIIQVVLCAAILTGWAVSVPAQDSLSEQKKAQNKLLAYRAARADAIRKLAERIKGLRITSETTVRDFVTESDQIQTALMATLSGMEETSKPKYMEDGTCSVTLKITMQEIITDLLKIRNAYYKGGKYKVEDIEKMTVTNTIKEFEETGMGAPRPDAPPAPELISIREGAAAESIDMPAGAKAYWMAHVTGQGRLLAIRAAHVDALRRLAERIKGVMIQSNTVVRDFVTESDFISLAMRTFMVGARETGIRYHPDELIVEVDMQVKLRTVYANIKSYVEEKYKGDTAKIKAFEEVTLRTEDIIVKETGMGVPREDTLKDVPRGDIEILDMARNAPDWLGELTMTGSAAVDTTGDNKAQAKLMAYRGAELDARRKLAEKLNGLVIQGKTTVRDFVTESDVIKTRMLAFQQGAYVVENSQKVTDDGVATVAVGIDTRPLWDMVLEWKKTTTIKSGPGGTEIRTMEKKVVAPAAD